MSQRHTPQSDSPSEPGGEDEPALIERVKTGDAEAFARLVESHYEAVATLVYRLLNRPDDVPDVVQDVFVRVLQKLDRYRGEAAFKTWLTRIAINRCRSEERWRLLRRRTYRRWAEQRQHKENGSPQRCDLHDRVQSAVENLPAKYREVIVLRYFQDWSVSDIADALGLTVNTVHVRLNRARERLQNRLATRLEEDNSHENA